MKNKKHIIIFIIAIYSISYCQSQNIKYREKILPKIKLKLDALYPHASSIGIGTSYMSDATQEISINCNCPETSGMIILKFDTGGTLLNKDIHYHTIKDLPDSVISFMRKNTSKNCFFDTNYMVKRITKKKEISYGIFMRESATPYMLWFKSSGEFIYREKMQGAPQ